jgi:hypothetical protein
MKSLIVGIFLLIPTLCNSQIIQHQISDDGYARVPLQFGFPYYGRVFTESYMFSNGVVGFLNPNYNSWCCTGFDLRTNNGTPFNFAIMPLQTDLINYGQGRFLTEGTPQYQRYVWENISEYGVPQNLNTFGVEIRPSGYIGMHYEQVNISAWRPVTIGMTGDVGQYTQYYHGAGFVSNQPTSYITLTTGDMCLVNPLYSPSCSGYEEAYTSQQCSLNPLYRPSCVGYEQAYLAQQCGISQLYSASCPNYQQAYFAEQCRLNPLYDRNCSGYAEAYALANVVPTSTVSTTTPSLQVSTTGTVSIETPVVADPVVNEVITRPQVNNVQTTTTTQTTVEAVKEPQKESKNEKKSETKQVSKPTESKNEVSAEAPKITVPTHEYKAPIILDLAYQKMVKKPIKDNNRAMYNLYMNSQIKHEEMVDEQYRR